MGRYINTGKDGEAWTPNGKADALLAEGATEINEPEMLTADLVCVVHNGIFDAAGYVYNEREFAEFTDLADTRPKRWFIVPGVEERAK